MNPEINMVRRSTRLAKPDDQQQAQVFLDLDDLAVIAKRQKSEEAAVVRKKRRIERGESTSSADTMIKDIMARSDDLRDHEPRLYRSSQLNTQLSEDDPRNAIVQRNSLQSPLLSLPAEIRGRIFNYAIGHQHIHILTDDYDPNTSVDLPGPARFGEHKAKSQIKVRQFHNCVFPIDWQSYYRFRPYQSHPYYVDTWVREHETERVITATNDRMTLLQAVCRQVYHETRFLPYELNEFSFQDEMTMKDWFGNRAAAQKRAINTVWFDLEWQRSYELFSSFARYHIGRSHGIRTVCVSEGAAQNVWPVRNWDVIIKDTMYLLLNKKEGELMIEYVK